MEPKSYKDVLYGLLYSVHSRRFILAVIGAHLAFLGAKYGLPAETIAFIMAPITAFILGESYQGGKQAEATASIIEGEAVRISPASQPVEFNQPLPSFEDSLKSTMADLASDKIRAAIKSQVEEEVERVLGKLVKP